MSKSRWVASVIVCSSILFVLPPAGASGLSVAERGELVREAIPGLAQPSGSAPSVLGAARPPQQIVDEEVVQRFIGIWGPAWSNAQLMRDHVAGKISPAGQVEFAALTADKQRYLVDRLYDHMQDTNPLFAKTTGSYSPKKS